MEKCFKLSVTIFFAVILVFTLTANSQPLVTLVSPEQNAISISPSTNMTVTFSEAMDTSSFDNGTFVVNGSLTGLHSGTLSFDSTLSVVTYTPDNILAEGEKVSVVLTTGIMNGSSTPLTTSFVWTFTTSVTIGTGYFSLDSVYTVDSLPHSIFTGDFDNDDNFDLATSNFLYGSVSVLLNDGSGNFGAQTIYAAGTETRYVYGADFDNDSYMDLAAGNGGSNDISVFINNGDGTFDSAATYVAGSGPHSIYSADLNGDGFNDIACGDAFGDSVSILLNNGDGTFATNVQYAAGTHPRSVYAADFDNDGDLDIATANLYSNTLSVFLNNGDGTFAASVEYGSVDSPRLVHSQDINGDGNMDLLSANTGSDDISVLFGDGDGNFTAPVDYSVGASDPYAVNASDFIVGGELELISANLGSANLTVFENDGSGIFSISNQPDNGPLGPLSLAVADFNGDVGLDVATANYFDNNISVFFNDSGPVQSHDSLKIPTISVFPCDSRCVAVQPVQTSLTQPIYGATIPIEVPEGVSICSLSVDGLLTEDWDIAILDNSHAEDSGYVFALLANTSGEVFPIGATTAFNIYITASSLCEESYFIHWDTALANNETRQLKFSDTLGQLILPGFNFERDSTEILGYVKGDFNADLSFNILDLGAFVNVLFRNGVLPCQINSADVNGDCNGPDIGDLVWMVNYLFRFGAAPMCGCIGS
jgi:hypothetical protein